MLLSSFSFLYLIRFNTNNKVHFLNNGDQKELYIKKLNFVTFKEPQEKSAFLEIAAHTFEAGDFLNIFLRYLGFWGSVSYKTISYKKIPVIDRNSGFLFPNKNRS